MVHLPGGLSSTSFLKYSPEGKISQQRKQSAGYLTIIRNAAFRIGSTPFSQGLA